MISVFRKLSGLSMLFFLEQADRSLQLTAGDQGELIWSDGIDLCSDSLYLEVSGKSAEEVFPSLGLVPSSQVGLKAHFTLSKTWDNTEGILFIGLFNFCLTTRQLSA